MGNRVLIDVCSVSGNTKLGKYIFHISMIDLKS